MVNIGNINETMFLISECALKRYEGLILDTPDDEFRFIREMDIREIRARGAVSQQTPKYCAEIPHRIERDGFHYTLPDHPEQIISLSEHNAEIRKDERKKVMDEFGILHGEDAKKFYEYMNSPNQPKK
jgi:hypothetical protein